MKKLILFLFVFALGFVCFVDANQAKPHLTLAKSYLGTENIHDYLVSEKYDGVRVFWNGSELLTKNGHKINAPTWFVSHLPKVHLDAELWTGYGQFEVVASLIRSKKINQLAWQQAKLMVFDLHDYQQPFSHRYQALLNLAKNIHSAHFIIVKQFSVETKAALTRHLQQVLDKGGEGLMLKAKVSLYQAGRSDSLLKLKRYEDAEAIVIRHIAGKGKHHNRLGALLVEMPNKIQFKIGTGFSDLERETPPPLGSVITYKYSGFTAKGIPRFASYLRQRMVE